MRGHRAGLAHPELRYSAIFMTAFALPFVVGWLFGAYMIREGISPVAGGLLLLGGIMAYVFYHLLKAPTLIGARALRPDRGLPLFLADGGEGPAGSPQSAQHHARCVREIPALCHRAGLREPLEQEIRSRSGACRGWFERRQHLCADLVVGQQFRKRRRGRLRLGPRRVARCAAASASIAPGSSSGSGGGGFSGGGGGGGGGGGW